MAQTKLELRPRGIAPEFLPLIAMRIGVDTGGTFTDCVLVRGNRIEIVKVFSTPQDVARGILKGVADLLSGRMPERIDLIHGTTVGTNTLIERRGARVALVTTAGFEDLIDIARQDRPRLYDLNVSREPPLVSPRLRWGVSERIAADGTILTSLSRSAIKKAVQGVRKSGADSVAICFLFSFLNSQHERRAATRRCGH